MLGADGAEVKELGRAPGPPGAQTPVEKTDNKQVNKMLVIVQTVLPLIMTLKDNGELAYIEWSQTVALKRGKLSRNR